MNFIFLILFSVFSAAAMAEDSRYFSQTPAGIMNKKNPSPPAGLTERTTIAAMQLQSNYSGWDFTTVWVMPTANPLSPQGILSPVLRWQCGANGTTCP